VNVVFPDPRPEEHAIKLTFWLLNSFSEGYGFVGLEEDDLVSKMDVNWI
jgi:hypothetical protein